MPLQLLKQDITKISADAIVTETPNLDKPQNIVVSNMPNNKFIINIKVSTPRGLFKARTKKQSLISYYNDALTLAVENKCTSIAFPLLKIGYSSFSNTELELAVATISDFLTKHEELELMVYLCIDNNTNTPILSQQKTTDIKNYIKRNYKSSDDDLFSEKKYHPESVMFSEELTKYGEDDCIEYEKHYNRTDPHVVKSKIEYDEDLDVDFNDIKDISDFISRTKTNNFKDSLLKLITASGMTDSKCYNKANIDRRTFSKIINQPDYHPSKATVLAFAIALELDLNKTEKLLASAGLALAPCKEFDLIVKYHILNKIYDINVVNTALFDYNQPLLGKIPETNSANEK